MRKRESSAVTTSIPGTNTASSSKPKFQLNRSTLRRLTSFELAGVAGGDGYTVPNTPVSRGGQVCDPHSA